MSTATSYSALLRRPLFGWMWLGETTGRFGFTLVTFLLPLIAVTELQANGRSVGLVGAAQFLPVLIVTLLAGGLAGRFPDRAVLVTCNVIRGGALGLAVVAFAAGTPALWQLLACALVVGTATVFFDVSYQSAIPRAVSAQELAVANGLLQGAYSVAQLAGPAAAGLLLRLTGASTTVTIAAVVFLAAGFAFLRMPRLSAAPAPTLTVRETVTRGLRFVWSSRPLRDLCLQAGSFNFFEQAFLTIFLVLSVRELDLDPGAVGLVIGLAGVGAFLGALLAPKLDRVRVGRKVTVSLPAAALALLAVPILVATDNASIPAMCVAFFANGVALATFNVYAVSLRQSLPPKELVGPATAAYRLVALGAVPLGAVVGGFGLDRFGGQNALLLTAGSMVAVSLLALCSPLRHLVAVETPTALLARKG